MCPNIWGGKIQQPVQWHGPQWHWLDGRPCVYCMGLVTYRSEICRKEKLLVKSRPSSSSLNWSAAVHVSSLKGLAKA